MIQAMIWGVVLTSGAGMSRSGPMRTEISVKNRRVRPSSSFVRELLGVDRDAALAAAVRDADDRALPGHPHREGLDLVERDVLVVADAALGRAAAEVVLDAVAGEDLDGAVVHVDREVDGQLAARLAEHRAEPRVEVEALRGEVELALRDLPGVDDGRRLLGGHGEGFLLPGPPSGCRRLRPPPRGGHAAASGTAAGRGARPARGGPHGATEFTLGRSSDRPFPAA